MKTDRRGFLGALAALPICAWLGGKAKADPIEQEILDSWPGQNFWATPNGEPITALHSLKQGLFVFTATTIYCIDHHGGTLTYGPPTSDFRARIESEAEKWQGYTRERRDSLHDKMRALGLSHVR